MTKRAMAPAGSPATRAEPGGLLRVFVKGGVISPADLLLTMDASAAAGNDFIMFSSRQEILFPAIGHAALEAEAVLRDADERHNR